MSLQDKIDAYDSYLGTISNLNELRKNMQNGLGDEYGYSFLQVPHIIGGLIHTLRGIRTELGEIEHNPIHMTTDLMNRIIQATDDINQTLTQVKEESKLVAEKPMELIENMTQPAARPPYD